MPRIIDLTGKRYGRLLVVGYSGEQDKHGNAIWTCQCDCGNVVEALGNSMKRGLTNSCGCLRRELTGKKFRTHGHCPGHRGTKTYSTWQNMLKRCYDETNKSYGRYGGRGITVCKRWHDFVNFLDDMGISPPDMSLDRINGDGNYEPGNCRWATIIEQRRNQRYFKRTAAFVDQVRKMYHLQGMNSYAIARALGCAQRTVLLALQGDLPGMEKNP